MYGDGKSATPPPGESSVAQIGYQGPSRGIRRPPRKRVTRTFRSDQNLRVPRFAGDQNSVRVFWNPNGTLAALIASLVQET